MKKTLSITVVALIAVVVVLVIQLSQTKQELKKQTEVVTEQTKDIEELKANIQKTEEFRQIAEALAEEARIKVLMEKAEKTRDSQ